MGHLMAIMLCIIQQFWVTTTLPGLLWWLSGKCLPADAGGTGLIPGLGEKIPWRKKWKYTPVFLPGKSQGQRSLVGYSLWSHKGVRHDLAIKPQYPLCLALYMFILHDPKLKFHHALVMCPLDADGGNVLTCSRSHNSSDQSWDLDPIPILL